MVIEEGALRVAHRHRTVRIEIRKWHVARERAAS